MRTQKILVPYNFTVYDEKALDFLIRTFANREDVHVTLFHTYIPLPGIDPDASPVMDKMKRGITFLIKELNEKEEGLKARRNLLLQEGFSKDQVDYIFKERKKSVADEIIETISKDHYRILIMSRLQGKTGRLFARSVHDKVLAVFKDITVCLVS